MLPKIREKVDLIVSSILTASLSVMLISVLWQIFTRYILGSASTVTEELARFLLIWIGLLGAGYIAGKDGHIAVDILPSRLTGSKKLLLLIFINITIIVFSFTALIIGGSHLVYTSFILEQTSAALEVPMAYIYLVVPISGILICFYKALDSFELLQFYRQNKYQTESN